MPDLTVDGQHTVNAVDQHPIRRSEIRDVMTWAGDDPPRRGDMHSHSALVFLHEVDWLALHQVHIIGDGGTLAGVKCGAVRPMTGGTVPHLRGLDDPKRRIPHQCNPRSGHLGARGNLPRGIAPTDSPKARRCSSLSTTDPHADPAASAIVHDSDTAPAVTAY